MATNGFILDHYREEEKDPLNLTLARDSNERKDGSDSAFETWGQCCCEFLQANMNFRVTSAFQSKR